jgi:adenylate cyclase
VTTASPGSETRHAAVINGDAAGYSALTADNEIETHHTLQAYRAIVEEVVVADGGELAQFVGDEFLAVLPDAAAAVSAAIGMQRRIAVENEKLPPARRMLFRLGLNAGAVSVEDGRWFGEVINVAARLRAIGAPGGICASGAVIDGAGEIPARASALGRRRLKNIPEPVRAFEIVDTEWAADEATPWRRRIPAPELPSIAASPFVNFGEPDDDHFADGLMMSLVIKLMTIPGLEVVSEGSTLGYRDGVYSAQQIGHELGVRYVLEGGVQRSGSRVRVLTQVVDVERSATVWADRFEAEIDDVFSAQDDIVARIVEALDVEVIGGDLARSYRDELDAESVEVVYRGLHEVALGTPESLRRASEYFGRLMERQPDAPLGYAMSAWVEFWAAVSGKVEESQPRRVRARRLAEDAIDRGDTTGIGHMVLAHMLLFDHDWEGAVKAASEAVSERPSCDLSFGVAASVKRYLGDWREAVELASHAIRLSPLMAGWYRTTLANAYVLGGQYEIAADTAESVVAEDETNTEALLTLAAAQEALGRRRHAAAALEQARATRPGLSAAGLRSDLPYRDESTRERFVELLSGAGLE